MSMYGPPDKMKMSAPGCFSTGRYSPTYRGPDQMRRCMTNPSVSWLLLHLHVFTRCVCTKSTFFDDIKSLSVWRSFTSIRRGKREKFECSCLMINNAGRQRLLRTLQQLSCRFRWNLFIFSFSPWNLHLKAYRRFRPLTTWGDYPSHAGSFHATILFLFFSPNEFI